MKLYLVRHGESEANKKGIYSGFLDTRLTKKGEEQARLCHDTLKHMKFDRVICSDLQRAYKTACIVSGLDKENIIIRQGLREMNFGRWEGLSHKEILDRDKDYYEKWMDDYYNIHTPEGESLNSFYDRVNSEFDDIKKMYLFNAGNDSGEKEDEKEKNILVVSHSGVIRALISKEILGSMKGYWKFAIDNCSVTVIEYDKEEFGFLKNLNYSGKI